MKKRAFTLIEVIVATFIVGMGFLAVVQLNPMGHRGGTVDKNRLIALRIARNVIDQARSMPFDTLAANVATLEGPKYLNGEQIEGKTVGLEFAVEKVLVTTTGPASPTPIGYGNITVTVVWHQGVGKSNAAGNNTLTMTGGLMRVP